MTNTVTPNMGMTVPTPNSELGPAYATEISNDLINNVDPHDHTTGKGVPITPAAMNINADLTLQNNNLTNARSARLVSNSGTLGGVGDVNCVYDVNGNLWFNNGSGTPVQITAGTVVNTAGPTIYSTFATSGNYAISTADSYVLIACDPTSNPITITLPLANGVPTGRFYIVKDSTGLSGSNDITVALSGLNTLDGSSSVLTIADNFWAVGFISDGVSNWHLLKWNKYTYLSGEKLTFNFGSTITGNPTIGNSAIFNLGGFSSVVGSFGIKPTYIGSLNSPYTIYLNLPIVTPAALFMVDSSGGAITINLPPMIGVGAAPQGTIIVIKDMAGSAASHNITIHPFTGDSIEQLAVDYIMQTSFGSISLVNNYSNVRTWSLI